MSKLAKRLEEMCYDVFPNAKNKMRMMTLAEVIEKFILECKPEDEDIEQSLYGNTYNTFKAGYNAGLREWRDNLEGGK